MIRYIRPSAPPSFQIAARIGTIELWRAWRHGEEIKPRRSIYADKAVKDALFKAQHKKCGYCETPFNRDHQQVEHYRPKSGWKQTFGHSLTEPGYFWLSYEWKNLVLSCAMCNDAGHKGNIFPLVDPANRASPRHPNISSETPLLLNPFDDNPRTHISWNCDVPLAFNGSARGQGTIEIFGLDRDTLLIDKRRALYKDIALELSAVERGCLTIHLRRKYITRLRRSIKKNAPYSAMIRAAFGIRITALRN